MRFHAVKISNFALDGAPDMGTSDLDREHLIHLDLSCFGTVSQDYVFLKYKLKKNPGVIGIYSVKISRDFSGN